MNASDIIKMVYSNFINYDYKLLNTFVFDWESDFFAKSKSGYTMEVEVKISRSDYFADFQKKEKHRLLLENFQKKQFYIQRLEQWRSQGDKILQYEIPVVHFQYHEDRWKMGMKNGKYGYIVNDYGRIHISKRWHQVYAQCSNIRIKPIEDILCPHYLYYACPEGLIKESEIPAYAGLIYCKGFQCTIVKKAPFLHKRRMDLQSVLLKKFYNLWLSVGREKKFELSAL